MQARSCVTVRNAGNRDRGAVLGGLSGRDLRRLQTASSTPGQHTRFTGDRTAGRRPEQRERNARRQRRRRHRPEYGGRKLSRQLWRQSLATLRQRHSEPASIELPSSVRGSQFWSQHAGLCRAQRRPSRPDRRSRSRRVSRSDSASLPRRTRRAGSSATKPGRLAISLFLAAAGGFGSRPATGFTGTAPVAILRTAAIAADRFANLALLNALVWTAS